MLITLSLHPSLETLNRTAFRVSRLYRRIVTDVPAMKWSLAATASVKRKDQSNGSLAGETVWRLWERRSLVFSGTMSSLATAIPGLVHNRHSSGFHNKESFFEARECLQVTMKPSLSRQRSFSRHILLDRRRTAERHANLLNFQPTSSSLDSPCLRHCAHDRDKRQKRWFSDLMDFKSHKDAIMSSSRREGMPPMFKPDQTPAPPPGTYQRQTAFFTLKGALFTAAVCGGIAAVWIYERNRISEQRGVVSEVEVVGKPKLGGPWTLISDDGRIVSNADFKGKYQLIYFGFTFCPDICPQELEKQALVIEKLDKEFGPIVQPLFITVDPARDTVAQVGAYCREFHPRLMGLTGTPGQIKAVSRAFRVYFNQGIRTDDEDYLVDHSIIQYFMGRNGTFKEFFGKNLTATEMANKIAAIIRADQRHEAERNSKRGQVTDEEA